MKTRVKWVVFVAALVVGGLVLSVTTAVIREHRRAKTARGCQANMEMIDSTLESVLIEEFYLVGTSAVVDLEVLVSHHYIHRDIRCPLNGARYIITNTGHWAPVCNSMFKIICPNELTCPEHVYPHNNGSDAVFEAAVTKDQMLTATFAIVNASMNEAMRMYVSYPDPSCTGFLSTAQCETNIVPRSSGVVSLACDTSRMGGATNGFATVHCSGGECRINGNETYHGKGMIENRLADVQLEIRVRHLK